MKNLNEENFEGSDIDDDDAQICDEDMMDTPSGLMNPPALSHALSFAGVMGKGRGNRLITALTNMDDKSRVYEKPSTRGFISKAM